MKECLLALGSALITTFSVATSHTNNSLIPAVQYEDTAYTRIITERAGKIVAALGISDSSAFLRVRGFVADQYRNLNTIYNDRDTANKDKKIAQLHGQYLARLATVLTPLQIDQVKDGMTYGVLPLTYRAYQEELPTLTEPQKAKILADLIEAREHAMDGGSSKEKHAWFGKYKGRINNYLSSQGYDMKKAGADWRRRISEKNDSSSPSQK